MTEDYLPPAQFDHLFASDRNLPSQAVLDTPLEAGAAQPAAGRKPNMADHLHMLATEFSGRPQLLFYHAGLIAHLRRGISVEKKWYLFDSLWRVHCDALINGLNSRWLLSASETYVDHSSDPVERYAGIAASLFVGSIKLYETERIATGSTVNEYQSIMGLVPLYDGVTAFKVGGGDMIINLFERVRRPPPSGKFAPLILRELIERARQSDTVFKRFADVHRKGNDLW